MTYLGIFRIITNEVILTMLKNESGSNSHHIVEWQQQGIRIGISVFELLNLEKEHLSKLLNDLRSRNVIFTFKLEKRRNYLLIYNFYQKSGKPNTHDSLLKHLKDTYSLPEITNSDNFFLSDFKKLDSKDTILKLKTRNNSEKYYLACLLSSVNLDTINIKRNLTNFISDLLKAELFSVVMSNIPNQNNKDSPYMWSLMLLSESNDFDKAQKKKKKFLRYLKTNFTKMNCQLSFVSKQSLTRHKTNFRFLLPWLKHKGSLFDALEIINLFHTENIQSQILSNEVTVSASQTEKPKVPQLTSVSLYRPFPSARELKNNPTPLQRKSEPSLTISNDEKIPEPNKQIAPSNLDDLTIPTPRSMNTTFDSEYLKVRMNKIFREFEFKETVIFEDSFDLVLRKGSYYIFVKFYQDVLNQIHANEIVDVLSSIAGLRNKFLCIVVADAVEENSKNILRDFNILHLTLNDVLLNEALKTKIYNTILA
jgi:hypothetical protein